MFGREYCVGKVTEKNAGLAGGGPVGKNPNPSSFDVLTFLTQGGPKRSVSLYPANKDIYVQGDPADSVFYVHKGKVKVTVTSENGKEAVVAIRGPDEFCGEGAMTGMPLRLSSATTMTECEIIRLDKETMERLLRFEPEFADYFLFHLLTRTARVEADLVDQLFNSSEMRLARALLLLTNYGGDIGSEPIPVKVNHDMLAKMVGTTRSRVTVFMNKFRKMGLIDYNGELKVHRALLNYVLHDESPGRTSSKSRSRARK
jgi:CRP/FNR family cyclic AMP-dependent transcriptional regulator